jgi:hypothetical protein
MTVLVYKEWLPDMFRPYPKADYEFTILLYFIYVNVIPLADIKITIFGMCPTLLVVSWIQSTETAKLLVQEFNILPTTIDSQLLNPKAYCSKYMEKMLLVCAIFLFSHYIQQLDVLTLICEKHMILNQQEQLDSYLKNQKDAIILFTHIAKSQIPDISEKTPKKRKVS